MLTARITGALAAIIWLVGTPLVAMAGVPFPSDAQYFYIGGVAVLLGLTLAPVTLAIGRPIPSRAKAFIGLSGLAICVALIVSGGVLILAVDGRLGERVTSLIPGTAFVVVAALFVWIGLASIASRGPSTVERAIFWIGLLTGVSFIVPILASILVFYLAPGFVVTNETVFPFLLIDLLIWVCLPAWLTAVIVGL